MTHFIFTIITACMWGFASIALGALIGKHLQQRRRDKSNTAGTVGRP
jgi:hypothetical protein